MNIKLVKLKSAGLKGSEVHYTIEEVKGNRKSTTLIKKYPKDPVQKDLENLFKDLRTHLLDICQITEGIDEDQAKFLILETEVTGVEFDLDGFILHGEKEVFGNKRIKLNTPKLEEIDNYHGFEEVMDIIKNIAAETKLYLEGEKKVSDEELVQRWVEGNRDKNMTLATLEAMSQEEHRDYCANVLEKQFGAIVLLAGDIEQEPPHVDEEQTFVVGGEEEIVIPVAEKKSKKAVA